MIACLSTTDLEKSAGMRSATGDRAGSGNILHRYRILERDGRTSVTELTLNPPSPALDSPRLQESAGRPVPSQVSPENCLRKQPDRSARASNGGV